ncbi:MAG: NAD(P)/FAD-dependent oxidoreductase [Burkholderiales bacterium]|nr:NAD(P)/FAD-dependent oxidoreductase [Burkholderiales bacterium]
MSKQYDIVVMGGGHNGLVAAAYLAKAGKSVLILERNKWVGGGVVTQELTVPGFRHDQHSISHVCIAANPLMTEDELGLLNRFGLEYNFLEIPSITLFPDGDYLCMHKDIEKTCESIAKFSQRDAETYRKWANHGRKVLPMFMQGMFTPPAPMGAFFSLLDQSQEGRDLFQLMCRSPLDIVNSLYESDKVKIHFLKPVAQLLQQPDDLGTGLCMLMIPGLMHTFGIPKPIGGSGRLSEALARCIQHYGGTIATDSEVRKVITEHGRAVGVEMVDGQRHIAKDAVLASIHPKRLERYIDDLSPDLLRRANQVKSSPFNILTAHYAIREKAKFAAGEVVTRASATEYATTTDFKEFLSQFDPLRYGRVDRAKLMFSGADQSHRDPSRAPPGMGVMLTQAFVPYFLADGGPQRWDEYKEEVADMIREGMSRYITNFTPENIIARTVDSPLDHERHSPNSFVDGDEHGLGSYMFQSGSNRPIPELSNYRVPGVDALYLCGPFMHPSGGVFGGGRATAIKMFEDLGLNFLKVAAADRVARPAGAKPTGFELKIVESTAGNIGAAAKGGSTAGAEPTAAAADAPGAVTIYGGDSKEMMTIAKLERDGDNLVLKGKIYGTVPLVAVVKPAELRKGLKLLDWKLVSFVVRGLFRK